MMTAMPSDRREFTPAALLRNPHVMTVLPGRWPRRALLSGVPTRSRPLPPSLIPNYSVSATGSCTAPHARPWYWCTVLRAPASLTICGVLPRKPIAQD